MIRIIHLSDPHFGAADSRISEKFLYTVAGLSPNLTIVSGDLTMRARKDELAAARSFIARLPVPHLVIPGNHDIPAINQPFDRFFRPFARYQKSFGENLEPEIRTAGVHVVSLNSSRAFGLHADWSEGRLSNQQLRNLIARFKIDDPTINYRILMLHHPILDLPIPGREVVKPLQKLLAATADAKVDLIACGHFHRSQINLGGMDDAWQSVISQAPTVCSTRTYGEAQGFHELRIEGERMEMTHHIFSEGSFVPTSSYWFCRGDVGWTHAPAE